MVMADPQMNSYGAKDVDAEEGPEVEGVDPQHVDPPRIDQHQVQHQVQYSPRRVYRPSVKSRPGFVHSAKCGVQIKL